ncbi:response regulator [Pleomorphovibrio marinus]|uniref:response regulator n=1 Tax=Pleomorphovibrio marinus TaxID=2164132 RepID=UPI000E0C8C23|nr:response regulator [Pleomorphovibrio marinus]
MDIIYPQSHLLQPILLFGQFLDKINSLSSRKSIKEEISQGQPSNLQFHVMIVDDDPDDQELLAEAFSEASAQVKISLAMNGKELFALLQMVGAEKPDLIIIDLNMPGINGFECLAAIKGNPLIKDIPIVIYSTSANQEQIDFTHKNGASCYIQKPNSFSDIKKIAAKILSIPIITFLEKRPREEFVLRPD